MELPLEQAKIANETRRIALEEQESEREAANQAAEHQQRDEDQAARDRKDQIDTQIDVAKLQSEHVRDLATAALENQPTAEDDANLRALNAKAYASMGAGAQGFAKAAETVQQGEEDLRGLDATLAGNGKPSASTKKPARRTNRAKTKSAP